jgi:hypothetical protein
MGSYRVFLVAIISGWQFEKKIFIFNSGDM